ncbi:MAG: arsenate reductase [Actinomycetota bacterium]|nr:arsenate reductase [Actinomycetota bacterium]
MEVQLFGLAKSKATRKAQRFFSERRVPVHFVDLRRRAPSPGELRKWVSRFGVDAVVDPSSRGYRDHGLRYLQASEDDWIARLVADPQLLRLPLARCGRDLAVGDDPAAWQRFADAVKG